MRGERSEVVWEKERQHSKQTTERGTVTLAGRGLVHFIKETTHDRTSIVRVACCCKAASSSCGGDAPALPRSKNQACPAWKQRVKAMAS